MPFKDYVELLYRAYLEDEEILQRLREKLHDTDYLKRLDGDPEFQDWIKLIQEILIHASNPGANTILIHLICSRG